ncbi:gluconate 2-dehydrogenase subunit 3 family protein [Algoriphagus sp. oki45]|uniref:Gluconate 2-dehydrogenase subunit 3 family protein n=1 Tax=Algoriphagus confluentis TaxID=1697556 RepID=A0ABQ6PTJ5_9BACT|nr:gluconate 2-dehydrogenase subunit 3 family protein [Algoriphagus sp. oki45]GMQ31284.1 gluconate 2-dehydrogenase subunit 3 family protein [Algoriphagus confluentis]
MNRRDALKSVALMMGGTMIGATAILTGCAPENQIKDLNFSPEDLAFLDEIGETIIPTTDTPGAKATKIGEFMQMMVKDTYDAEQQQAFIDGLNTIRKEFKAEKGSDFIQASAEDRLAYLNGLQEQFKNSGEERKPIIINMLRDLTVLGYFTSEIGASQALRYVEVPGRYDGCIDYQKGDKAWAI